MKEKLVGFVTALSSFLLSIYAVYGYSRPEGWFGSIMLGATLTICALLMGLGGLLLSTPKRKRYEFAG